MPPFSIRPYNERDLPRLREITIATFGPVSIDRLLESRFGPFGPLRWQERKSAAIDEDCRLQPDGVFVAEDEAGRVLGYVTTRLSASTGIGWIPNIAVSPDCQGAGIGRALLRRAVDHLRERGMSVAKIETLAHNEIGKRLYPSVGFVEITRQIHYAMRLDAPSMLDARPQEDSARAEDAGGMR